MGYPRLFVTKSAELVLLSTSACSACELALDLLFSMPELAATTLSVVDIVDDPALVQRYGSQIPVLLRMHEQTAQSELCWPFTAEQVAVWIGGAPTQ